MSKEVAKAVGGRKNQNVVEVNAQWREAVKKEMEHHNLNEHFDFNPKKLIIITDKPHLKKKRDLSSTHEEISSLKKKLEVLTTVPKMKYPFPVTAAQEVGWDNAELFEIHRPKYAYNRGLCNETKYANDYVIMTHKSPFLTNKKVVEAAAPKK